MQVKPLFPDQLVTFALATTGTYSARYDQILETSFFQFQLWLSAVSLRQLAGGGSNTTAQEAIDRFRAKLHKTVSSRIEFGAEIPEEVASRINTAMTEVWTACLGVASANFSQERQQLTQETMQHLNQAQDALAQLADAKMQATQLEERLESSHQTTSQMQVRLDGFALALEQSRKTVEELNFDLRGRTTELAQAVSELAQSKAINREQLSEFQSEKSALTLDLKSQMNDLKRGHQQVIERLSKDLMQARGSESRERAFHAETSIRLAKTEQKLSQATDAIAILDATMLEKQSHISRLEDEVMAFRKNDQELRQQLSFSEVLQQQAKAQLEILEDIRKTLQVTQVNGLTPVTDDELEQSSKSL